MRKLSELGISPAPWKVIEYGKRTDSTKATGGALAFDDDGEEKDLFEDDLTKISNARLIAAAPKLYKYLREAVVEKCEECHGINDYESDISIEWEMCKHCPVKKWRAVLAEAAGEEAE